MQAVRGDTTRPPLTRERVVRAAVALADREGLDALTMRRLGADLGVQAMSLYKHVANKEEILDAIVASVIAEIEIPRHGDDWRDAMHRRAKSARQVLTRHAWAIGLLESRRLMGPAVVAYLDAIVGCLRAAGFSIEQAAHAFWLLDCYVYGQVIQEISLSPRASAPPEAAARSTPDPVLLEAYPSFAELIEHAGQHHYTLDGEFEHGLELILDSLQRTRRRARRTGR